MLLYYNPILCPKYFMPSMKVILDLNQIKYSVKYSVFLSYFNSKILNVGW